MEDREAIHIPDGVRYSCVQCGLSCSLFLEVTLEQRSRETLETIDYRDLLPSDRKDRPAYHQSPVEPERLTIAKRDDSFCVFIDDDKLCRIHKAHGLEKKPQTCKDFPWRFVDTPGGAYAGLSFACTAVLQHHGQTGEEQRADLEAQHPVANSRNDAERTPRLTFRHEISWEAYLELERGLLAIQEEGSGRLAERLGAQAVYLDMAVALLREDRGDSPQTGRTRTPAEAGGGERFPPDCGANGDLAVAKTVNQQFLTPEGHARLLRIVRRAKGSAAFHRAFLGMIIAFRQNLANRGDNPTRFEAVSGIVRHYLGSMMKIGRIRLEALEAPFDWRDLRRYGFDWEAEPGNAELLERYFRHCLLRKDLLMAPSIWIGQRFLIMNFSLIYWHAAGLAALSAKEEIDLEILRQAVRHVERHYAYHTHFGKLFEKIPLLGSIVDGAARKPSFGASLIYCRG